MSAKLLKISFVILLLVTAGELGYYFYILNAGKGREGSQANQFASSRETRSILNNLQTSETVIKADIIDFLRTRPKSENQKFYMIGEEKGYIGNVIPDEINRTVQINIVDKDGNKVVNYVLSRSKSYPLFMVTEGKKTAVTIDQLQKGFSITHTLKMDLSEPSKIIEEEFLLYEK